MKLIIASIVLILSTPVWSTCLETSSENISVSFEAYKTPLKIGVGAKLPAVSLDKKARGATWDKAAKGRSLTIDTSKVDSGDASRDKKISKFFFDNKKINAELTYIYTKKKQLLMKVTMEGNKTLDKVMMKYSFENNTLKAQGYVDALDLGMANGLAAINKACLAKHEGKTWSDVKIMLEAKFSECK